MVFEAILKNEVKRLNQARKMNNKLNKDNKELAQLNSYTIKAQLVKLGDLKNV